MIHPMTLLSIIKGGLLVSCRNYLTELLFGLKWRGFGRYPTGIFLEDFEERRCELIKFLPNHHPEESPEFERMYSIRIRAPKDRIFDALGTFGDLDRKYFKPRFVTVHRIDGKANELGSVIQYDLPLKFMSFRIALEKFERGHYLLYRIMDGFAKGGVLIFDIENHKKAQLLSIYVAYNFQEGDSFLTRLFWGLFERLFPQYMHDVLWNHSLCKFKDIVEFDG